MTHDPKLLDLMAAGMSDADGWPWTASGEFHRNTYRRKATAALDAIEAMGCVVLPVEQAEAGARHLRYLKRLSAIFEAHRIAARPGAQP